MSSRTSTALHSLGSSWSPKSDDDEDTDDDRDDTDNEEGEEGGYRKKARSSGKRVTLSTSSAAKTVTKR